MLLTVIRQSYDISKVIKRGLRHLVDRESRRDLSVFRTGYDFPSRQLAKE